MSQDFIIGIDLGGTNTKIGLLDNRLKIKDKIIFSTQKFRGKECLINALLFYIQNLLNKHKIRKEKVRGVGIGLPGPIDSQKGIVHYFPNIAGWKEVSLARIIRQKIHLPVLIDNDVNLITLAEFKLGAGKKSRNMVCLTLGTGVGGGIIVEGKLYRGSSLSAGEIGHIPVAADGPKCGCGAKGCLESYIGNSRILKKAKALFGAIKLEELTQKARHGNREARKLWQEVGSYLGLCLSGIVNFFNPDCIVIGGGVAGAGSILFDAVEKVVIGRAMAPAKNIVKIVRAKLGQDAGIIGAALLFIE
ncbi:MAG: ROK family protein [Candidatus Omnitrophota bacterium]|nr:ROK family protein [Candidatus Omnitrophota bacterium]